MSKPKYTIIPNAADFLISNARPEATIIDEMTGRARNAIAPIRAAFPPPQNKPDRVKEAAMRKLSDPGKNPSMSKAEAEAALGRKKSWVYENVRRLKNGRFSTAHVKELLQESAD